MLEDDETTRLTRSLFALFADADVPGSSEIADAWPTKPYSIRTNSPSALPVLGYLPAAPAGAPAAYRDLARALGATADRLAWRQTYNADDLDEAFLDGYGWTIVVGPGGVVDSDDLIAAFLLLGPGIEYPLHRHSPEEIYRVVSGRSSWKVGDGGWKPLGPGAVVHNPPWQPHGMRTDFGEPLLAACLWRSGALEKSRFP